MKKAALVALLFASGCADDLANRQLQATSGRMTYAVDVNGFEGKDEAAWDNSGTQAVVDWKGTKLTEGQVTLQLFDGAGEVVYEKTATVAANPDPAPTDKPGANHNWRAVFLYRGAKGTVAVDAQGAR